MSKGFAVGFGITALVIPLLVWWALSATKGNHLAPVTKIGKVRVQKVDESESIAILDFSVDNQSDRKLVVQTVESQLDSPDGSHVDGSIVAARDLDIIFRNYPELGERYNPPFKAWDEVKPHERLDRMIGVRFDVPDEKIAKRKDIDLRLQDISGTVVDLKGR
jgi:hypothetical protein